MTVMKMKMTVFKNFRSKSGKGMVGLTWLDANYFYKILYLNISSMVRSINLDN